MAVPEQIRKQTEAVQALYDDLNVTTGSPKKGETPAKGFAVEETSSANRVAESVPTSKPAEQGSGGQTDDWHQKYQTLQGMYNADVPRLNAQNQELGQRVHQMEQLIATMQAAPPPAAPLPPVSVLTADEIDEYGESIDIMRKVSQEVAGRYQQRIDRLEATIQQLQGSVVPRVEQLANRQAQSAEQSFWAELQSTIPDWRAVNDNQAFQNWLLEVDPLSGLTRQTYLDDAQRNLDAVRVASFFRSWQTTSGAVTAQPNRSSSKSELEKQVSPGKSRSGGSSYTGDAKTYTAHDISEFFKKVRMGGFKGREAERDTIERDIFAAQAEGRIVHA
jgi:hypothetical protein